MDPHLPDPRLALYVGRDALQPDVQPLSLGRPVMIPAIAYAGPPAGELPPEEPRTGAREIPFETSSAWLSQPRRSRCSPRERLRLRVPSLGVGMPSPVSQELLRALCERASELDVDGVTIPLGEPVARKDAADESPVLWRLPPLTETNLDGICCNLEAVQAGLGEREVYVETCAYLSRPAGAMSEAVFLRRILERTNCGWSIDVTGTFANGKNFAFDPLVFVAQVLSAVGSLQVRLSGGRWEEMEQRYAIAVREPISEELLRLLRQILRLAGERTTGLVLERVWEPSRAEEVRSELQRIRRTVEETCGGVAPRRPPRRSAVDMAEWLVDAAVRTPTRN